MHCVTGLCEEKNGACRFVVAKVTFWAPVVAKNCFEIGSNGSKKKVLGRIVGVKVSTKLEVNSYPSQSASKSLLQINFFFDIWKHKSNVLIGNPSGKKYHKAMDCSITPPHMKNELSSMTFCMEGLPFSGEPFHQNNFLFRCCWVCCYLYFWFPLCRGREASRMRGEAEVTMREAEERQSGEEISSRRRAGGRSRRGGRRNTRNMNTNINSRSSRERWIDGCKWVVFFCEEKLFDTYWAVPSGQLKSQKWAKWPTPTHFCPLCRPKHC